MLGSCSDNWGSAVLSSSNSDSNYNLSNPKAELCEAIPCLDVSSSELEGATSLICEIDTRYGCRMDVETYCGSL